MHEQNGKAFFTGVPNDDYVAARRYLRDAPVIQDLQGDLSELLSERFVDELLKMSAFWTDRDVVSTWLVYPSFGDWYADHKHLFIVGFSNPDRLIARIVSMYIVKQMHTPIKHGPDGTYEMCKALFDKLIEEHYPAIRARLAQRWPAEFEDMLARNANPSAGLGLGFGPKTA